MSHKSLNRVKSVHRRRIFFVKLISKYKNAALLAQIAVAFAEKLERFVYPLTFISLPIIVLGFIFDEFTPFIIVDVFISYLAYFILSLMLFYKAIRLFFIRNPISKYDWQRWKKNPEFISKLSNIFKTGHLKERISTPANSYTYAHHQEDVDAIINMNLLLFSDSQFRLEKDKLKKRNISICDKNPYTHRRIFDPNVFFQDDFGFTAVFPLGEAITTAYINGNIKDTEFTGEYICSDTSTPKSILIFSVGDYQVHKGLAGARSLLYLLTHIVDHVTHIVEMSYADDETIILFQADKPLHKMVEVFGFEPLNKISADGLPIYSLTFGEFKKKFS